MPTLTTLVSFNGSDGQAPQAGLTINSAGNLYGTTWLGGPFAAGSNLGWGTLFEIVGTGGSYANAPSTLVDFNFTNGANPQAGLVADAAGDLFGTTQYGGASGFGTVFEIARTGSSYANTATILASFNGTDGDAPLSGLIVDAAGDLFGTTEFGGASGDGTVFEITRVGGGYVSTPNTLASFTGSNGQWPRAGLISDAAGDLFGTTAYGGAYDIGAGGTSGDGTVFEIAKTSSGYASAPTTLANFNATDGQTPQAGLMIDAAGDLFGTTEFGGTNDAGTVFEIPKTASGYAGTPTTLINFNFTDGEEPQSGLISDAAGNLFGTTAGGGASGLGTVFELARTGGGYAGAPTVLANFAGANGSYPVGNLIADSNGDIFGTTYFGGANGYSAGSNGDGTVFEVSGAGFQPTVAPSPNLQAVDAAYAGVLRTSPDPAVAAGVAAQIDANTLGLNQFVT